MKRAPIMVLAFILAIVIVVGLSTLLVLLAGGSGEASETISAEQLIPEGEGQTVFRIDQEQSVVRFVIDELLRGEPTTVIGVTNQVAGDILVDWDDAAASIIGPIRINARTLATDSVLRDRVVRGQILESAQDEYEFIEFAPTALQGLPETVTIGEPIAFDIVGDLTIRDLSGAVTFAATVTPVSQTRLEGTARGTVLRVDYNLNIPDVPNVADVSEEVILEIDFVALAVAE